MYKSQIHGQGMAGVDGERARKELGIPDDFDLGAAVALGYVASPDQLPEQYRQSELSKRQRKPLTEIVFGANWNEPLQL